MKKFQSADEFHKIIKNYKDDPDVDAMGAVFEALWILSGNILKMANMPEFKNKTNVMARLVAYAFVKMEKYDPEKGKAFNFFTTIMLCWMRQEYRRKIHKYADLKAKYEKSRRDSKDK